MRLERLGPARLLRCLASLPRPLRLALKNQRFQAEIDVSAGLVVGAICSGTGMNFAGPQALAAFAVLRTGDVRVEAAEKSEHANMMLPVDDALGAALREGTPIRPSHFPGALPERLAKPAEKIANEQPEAADPETVELLAPDLGEDDEAVTTHLPAVEVPELRGAADGTAEASAPVPPSISSGSQSSLTELPVEVRAPLLGSAESAVDPIHGVSSVPWHRRQLSIGKLRVPMIAAVGLGVFVGLVLFVAILAALLGSDSSKKQANLSGSANPTVGSVSTESGSKLPAASPAPERVTLLERAASGDKSAIKRLSAKADTGKLRPEEAVALAKGKGGRKANSAPANRGRAQKKSDSLGRYGARP